MRTLIRFISFFVATSPVYSQELISTENIADLKGAVEIERNGSYTIEFTGNWGWDKDLSATSIAEQIKEKNSIFLIKRCLSEGDLVFEINYKQPTLQLAIFKFNSVEGQKTPEIKDMKLVYLSKELQSKYSNKDQSDEYKLPDFKCEKGESFLIIINNIKKSLGSLSLTMESKVADLETIKTDHTKIFDDRLPKDNTSIVMKFVDEEFKTPVICSATLISKKKTALFIASEIILGSDSKAKLQVRCDAEGYFFKDTILNLTNTVKDTIEIPMKSISVGKIFKIDKIEFVKGTANLIPGTESILRRVKDFLILNSDVRIEIQGHVNNEGEENKKSAKLSAKRALTIKKYFIKAGINKDRMTHKGYGNSQPIFPTPKNEDEQQANRRVEIKIVK